MVIFEEQARALRALPDGARLAVYDALMDFIADGVEPDFPPASLESIIWLALAPVWRRSRALSEAGRRGGLAGRGVKKPRKHEAKIAPEIASTERLFNEGKGREVTR